MPVLKNPHQLKAASSGPGDSGGGGSHSRTLILAKESPGTNPFEEDLEENEKDSFLGGISPGRERTLPGDREDFERGLFSGNPEDRFRRRATLEKLVGLSPFRLGRSRKSGEKRSPGGEQGSDQRSFLERMMLPLMEGNLGQRMPEKKKPRRCSEDFSLLQRFNGRRKEGLYSSDYGPAENGGGDTAKRGSFLKIGLGGKVRRASLVEKLNQTEGLEAAPAVEKQDLKPKEPLSGESGLTEPNWEPTHLLAPWQVEPSRMVVERMPNLGTSYGVPIASLSREGPPKTAPHPPVHICPCLCRELSGKAGYVEFLPQASS